MPHCCSRPVQKYIPLQGMVNLEYKWVVGQAYSSFSCLQRKVQKGELKRSTADKPWGQNELKPCAPWMAAYYYVKNGPSFIGFQYFFCVYCKLDQGGLLIYIDAFSVHFLYSFWYFQPKKLQSIHIHRTSKKIWNKMSSLSFFILYFHLHQVHSKSSKCP